MRRVRYSPSRYSFDIGQDSPHCIKPLLVVDGRLTLASGGKLFANRSEGGAWLCVRLEGDGKTVNRSAIGAQVRVRSRGRVITRQVEAGTGEGNQNDLKLHFGLGAAKGPVDLEVSWPGGKRQVVRGVKLNQTVDVKVAP